MGRGDESIALKRDVYANSSCLDPGDALTVLLNLVYGLRDHGLYAEAVSLVRGKFAATCRKYGRDHTEVVRLCWTYGAALCAQEGASRDDMIEGLALLEDACKRSRRIFGADHQITIVYDGDLRKARARVAHFFPEAAGAP